MDVRQLAALVAIADHGTFSAAARALFTVQSNVSGHVARLEREELAFVRKRGLRVRAESRRDPPQLSAQFAVRHEHQRRGVGRVLPSIRDGALRRR